MDYRKIVRYSLMLVMLLALYFIGDLSDSALIVAYLIVDIAWNIGESFISETKRKNTIEIYNELSNVLTDCEDGNSFSIQIELDNAIKKAIVQKAIKSNNNVKQTLAPMYGFEIELKKRDKKSCDYIDFEVDYIKFGTKVATEHRAKGVLNFTAKSLDAMYVTVTDTGLMSQI